MEALVGELRVTWNPAQLQTFMASGLCAIKAKPMFALAFG